MLGPARIEPTGSAVSAAAGWALVGCTVFALTVSAFGVQDAPVTAVTITFLRASATAAFVVAGILRLARWWITSDARSAYAGAALLLLGGLSLPLVALARLLSAGQPRSVLPPATQTIGTLVCFALVQRALEHGDDDSLTLDPRDVLTRAAIPTTTGFLLLVVARSVVPGLLVEGSLVPALLTAALAGGWFTLAWSARRRESTQAWTARLTPLLACMGAAEVLHLLDLVDLRDVGLWRPAEVSLVAAVGIMSVCCAVRDLYDAAAIERDRVTALSTALTVATQTATEHEARREEVTHDMRNAVAGLGAALHTLEAHGARLDPLDAAALRAAAVDEVSHLRHLLEGTHRVEPVPVDVGSVVRTVVATRRATGQDVRIRGTAPAAVTALGSPGDLATVLQNLIVNAGVHAPDSAVTVSMSTVGSSVEIAVSDRGPGVRPGDEETIFTRGVRGPASPGSGLGLYVARSLMRAHGGDVELRRGPHGATFAVTLRTAGETTGQMAGHTAGPRGAPPR